jgi:alpha-amylase
MMKKSFLLAFSMLFIFACGDGTQEEKTTEEKQAPFVWENANVYFLMTDRFYNGDKSNDANFNRTAETSELRKFMGGDIKGITKKIKEGYFTQLGINAIWLTPIVEQIHGYVDEGQGATYGYHGYWTKDWTAIDPNFGTEEDMHELVKVAHENGIRILLDVVVNHTGPVTENDPVWPEEWVRTKPQCTYQGYESAVTCTLVKNLPDIRTESNDSVGLPEHLKQKWEKEGRLEEEVAELDAFFEKTGMVRAPKNYIIKWLTDFIRKFGIDGYRIDTVKHVEESVWGDLIKEALLAFKDWKKANPEAVIDDNDFYVVGELYGYNIYSNRNYDFGDRKVDYFDYGFNSLINFGFKYDAAQKSLEELFSYYSAKMQDSLGGKHVMNYISSHDDGQPFDLNREKAIEAGTKLLLCPGVAQVYYGDESSRLLVKEGANGDANLRTFMNWDEIESNASISGVEVSSVLTHWQKLGQFRNEHPAVGAGVHKMISETPYYFRRNYKAEKFEDKVVVGLDLEKGKKEVQVKGIFEDGTILKDYYSNKSVEVKDGMVSLVTDFDMVLLAKPL